MTAKLKKQNRTAKLKMQLDKLMLMCLWFWFVNAFWTYGSNGLKVELNPVYGCVAVCVVT